MKRFGWGRSACPSMPHHRHPHTCTLHSALNLEMGAEGCAQVWRTVLAQVHTFGLPWALRTPVGHRVSKEPTKETQHCCEHAWLVISNGRKHLWEEQTFSLFAVRFEAPVLPRALNKKWCRTATAVRTRWRGQCLWWSLMDLACERACVWVH